MKTKVSKDELSIDAESKARHKWVKGVWNSPKPFKERIDTCANCGCKRIMISYYSFNFGHYVTEVSSYERSGVSMPAKPAPSCWGSANPK